jgi:hypothetical protein
MSAFELYDMDNLINTHVPQVAKAIAEPYTPQNPHPELREDADMKIQHLIDERLALHDLVGKVVEKKIMEKEAIHQMMMAKLTAVVNAVHETAEDGRKAAYRAIDYASGAQAKADTANVKAEVAKAIAEKAIAKKKRPLQSFLDQKKQKVFSIPLHMTKGERIECPDCGKNIFEGTAFSGCICLGDDRERKIFIKKSEHGVNVRFSRGWDPENIEMLLELLKKK